MNISSTELVDIAMCMMNGTIPIGISELPILLVLYFASNFCTASFIMLGFAAKLYHGFINFSSAAVTDLSDNEFNSNFPKKKIG